jgi:tagatose-1,6-bisphosphate aldolase non-catalytic subunit AgaZ/GatZ
MKDRIDSRIGFGPMSPEIIEGILKASAKNKKAFMLIATQRQIDWDRGYVSNWTTPEYVDFVNGLKRKYRGSEIYLCRDHCGPGFKSDAIKDFYMTVNCDIECGFDLIHVDFSRVSSDKKVVLNETRKAINKILEIDDDMLIEIGTEVNTGLYKDNIDEIREELYFIKNSVQPEFFVVQTGSLVKEINQVGNFNKKFIERVHALLSENSVKLKEHNADYLSKEEIMERKGVVDAFNIAPQLGVLQTLAVINEALFYGVCLDEFLTRSYESRAWEKWMYHNDFRNKMLCSVIAGHYNFISDEYKKVIDQLEKYVDIKQLIVDRICDFTEETSASFCG